MVASLLQLEMQREHSMVLQLSTKCSRQRYPVPVLP